MANHDLCDFYSTGSFNGINDAVNTKVCLYWVYNIRTLWFIEHYGSLVDYVCIFYREVITSYNT